MRRILLLIFLGLAVSLQAEKEDESKLAYESGMIQTIAGQTDLARASFEKAASISGDYADLARTQLLRMRARDGKTALSALLALFAQIKDQALAEQAAISLAGALRESRRYADSIAVCLQLVGKYPESSVADDALLMSAQIYFEQGKHDAARVQAEQIIRIYGRSDSADGAKLILARLYLVPDENYNPALACAQWERIAQANSPESAETVIEPDFTRICSSRIP
ncbi:MAG: tetratricopeptide repeat protein [Spirochaetia bacterium]|nr:tetratricopeptide repeat protein [Spirochaetia bacterium]